MIKVVGIPSREREYLIEEAIRLIQTSPQDAMVKQYLGIKNYAAFGDQREDHPYGMGPRHGSIVFSIGRCGDAPIVPEDVEELIRIRDFGGKRIPQSIVENFRIYTNCSPEPYWNYQNAVRAKLALLQMLSDVEKQLIGT